MPIYMDLHIIPGVKAKDVANAHLMDTMIQEEHQCKCMTYWVDEARGHVFCLIDAPSKEIVTDLHDQAHGLIPHQIIEVQPSVVESFLGRISDPQDAPLTDDGLKLINESSFRVILVTMMQDPVLLKHVYGNGKTADLLGGFKKTVREEIARYKGRETEHDGYGYIISFKSAADAFHCAWAIHHRLSVEEKKMLNFRVSIHAGEPVTASDTFFGDTIRMATRLKFIQRDFLVAITPLVKKLVANDFENHMDGLMVLSPADEKMMSCFFDTIDARWEEPENSLEDFCRGMGMSKSQLYRKVTALTGLSPKELLNHYKLEMARELLSKQQKNISQVTFEAGFSSPSYFTKCFKKKFGVLPMAYVEMQSRG